MANYLKPQSPLQHKDGNYFYPLTTVDQILNDDGSRFNTSIISVNLDNAEEGPANKINADTLNGYTAEELMQAKNEATIIINVIASDGAALVNVPIKITNALTGEVIKSFVYGSPYTFNVPLVTEMKIECGQIDKYVAPAVATYVASAANPMIITLMYQLGKRYGYRREKAESSPSDRITYLYDAVGMTPASTDLSSNVFNPGDWGDFIEEVARPVMLTFDGKVDYELDHNDQTKKLDGSMSDITDTNYGGNAMVEFRKYKWVKRYQDDKYEYVIFSDIQWDDTYHAYAHMNANGDVRDVFYWGMFKGTNVSSKLRSMGVNSPMGGQNRQTAINYAAANGVGHYIAYKSGVDYIGDLITLISKSDNSQEVFGYGRSSSSSTQACGSLKNKPAFWGTSINKTSSVKCFWIEDIWGCVWEGIVGCINDKGNILTKMYPPYNLTGEGYFRSGITLSGTNGGFTNNHYMSDETGFIPVTSGSGSATTYNCDGLWFNNAQINIALAFGGYDVDFKDGIRAYNFEHVATSTSGVIGARVTYIEP